MLKVMTICFLVKKKGDIDLVCLAEKKRGYRVGKINGYGGKLVDNETIEECAMRETMEESGVTPIGIVKSGEVRFYDPELTHECHVYVITDWEGEATETEEMLPAWYAVDAIPFERMGQADRLWVPLVLGGKKVIASFHYDENDFMYRSEVAVVEEL